MRPPDAPSGKISDEELHAVVSLLAGPGVVWELKFGSWVLLQPERINAYAQAVIQTIGADEHERGCLTGRAGARRRPDLSSSRGASPSQ